MDAGKYKKLEEYLALLVKTAEGLERDGEKVLAIEKYLKAVDVILVMAEAAPNYPAWLQLTDKADSYQKKVKSLIASASADTVSQPPVQKLTQPHPLASKPTDQ